MNYRIIAAGDESVGGVFGLTDEMRKEGARPVWLGYIGVDDVDATAVRIEECGGRVLMPAKDVPDAGRMAMVADPEGVPFYIMRGAVEDGTSTAFQPGTPGHCVWNELATNDQAGALDFYGTAFGWSSTEAMPMGDMGDYKFIDHAGQRLGAISPHVEDGVSSSWNCYFAVADIDGAVRKAEARGARILQGPHEVPGGDHIIIGEDPECANFALIGPKANP